MLDLVALDFFAHGLPWIEASILGGRGSSFVSASLEQLQGLAPIIDSMRITLHHAQAVIDVHAFLQQNSMPQLESLQIFNEVRGNGGSIIFELPPNQYPSLQDLTLRNAMVALKPLLASHLRSLDMGSPDRDNLEPQPNPWPKLSLALFLDCLPYFSQLEHLVLRNCFGAPEPVFREERPAIEVPELRIVTIEDHPYAIAPIVSELALQRDVEVTLIGDLRGTVITIEQCGEAFMGMLGRDYPRNMGALAGIARIDVASTIDDCSLLARGSPDETHLGPPKLHVALRTDFGPNPDPVAAAARGWFFRFMVKKLKCIFSHENEVTHLKLVGDVDAIDPAIWAPALVWFSELTDLSIRDETLRQFPAGLFDALKRRVGANVLCPKIEAFALYGALTSEAQLEEISRCLEVRGSFRGFEDLRALEVELYSEELWDPDMIKRHRQRLYRDTGLKGLEVKLRQ